MDALRWFLLLLLPVLASCQTGYYWRSAQGQWSLWWNRVPLEKVLAASDLTPETRQKMLRVQEAKEFSERVMGLKKSRNYSSYVDLQRDAVTYVVNASPKWELRHHLWGFPIIGKVPYKGFFSRDEAEAEAADLSREDLDTHVRGVSAYSTLGWFHDPLLSSMMRMSEHDLVDTVIHELVHVTLYIKSSADFNERLATFLGGRGALDFYREKEGPESPTLVKIREDEEDRMKFSQFITHEIADLKSWYKNHNGPKTEDVRQRRLQEIQDRYASDLLPRLKDKSRSRLGSKPLNNARLMLFKTYEMDLVDFEKIFEVLDRDYSKFLALMKNLEKDPEPDKKLKTWAQSPREELEQIIKN